jgi:hypothetical protein
METWAAGRGGEVKDSVWLRMYVRRLRRCESLMAAMVAQTGGAA